MRWDIMSLMLVTMLFSKIGYAAANAVNLRDNPQALLGIKSLAYTQSLAAISSSNKSANTQTWMKKVNEEVDATGMKHVHAQQYYGAYPVWGGDAIIHSKNNEKLVNGRVFSGFESEIELRQSGEKIFTPAQQQLALQQAAEILQKDLGHSLDTSKFKIEKWIYPEEKNNQIRLHYAYLIKAENYCMFLDAVKPAVVYLKWQSNENVDVPPGADPKPAADNSPKSDTDSKPASEQPPKSDADPQPVPKQSPSNTDSTSVSDTSSSNSAKAESKTLTSLLNDSSIKLDLITMVGLGGNELIPRIYDGKNMEGHYPSITMIRESNSGVCYSFNMFVIVLNAENQRLISFPCKDQADEYFNGRSDYKNGAFNVTNDALYLGEDVQKMYTDWLHYPLLKPNQDGGQNPLIMRIHAKGDMYDNNAAWSPYSMSMTFGDGGVNYFPMVTPDVVAHELSHAFTTQNSRLVYVGASGAINESFSDMAAKAYEVYSKSKVHGKYNSQLVNIDWTIGTDVAKPDFHPMRYFINPTHDAMFYPRGISSIDNVNDFVAEDTVDGKKYMDPHLASGIFNKEFYLLSQRWGIQKTFAIMAQANRHWWIATTDFMDAACGVKNSAKNYALDLETIAKDMKIVDEEMAKVGIDTTKCNQI